MRRAFSIVIRRSLSVVVATALAVTLFAVAVPSAQAYTPTNKLVFNNIKGSTSRKYAIITEINRSISAARPGSTIYMAQYLFDQKSTTDRLIAAHGRKVNVRFLIDDSNYKSYWVRKLRSALGTNKRARSFVAKCSRSCMSNRPSSIHAKLYLFSHAGNAKYVSMISSANPHKVNTIHSWNNIHTIVNNKTIYTSLQRYFNDMLKDRTNHNYYRTTTSGPYTLYYFPRAARRASQITMLNALNHTSCRRVSKGYGRNGRTVIRIGMWGWTAGRNDVARRLLKLHGQGCKVDVIINRGRIGKTTLGILLKRNKKYGKIKVYDAWVDKNNNNTAGRYIHHKLLMINGRHYGKGNVKVVFTGSQNFTVGGTLYNNDIILRIRSNSIYNAYNRNMNYIRDRGTKRLTSVPKRVGNPATGDLQISEDAWIEANLDR